MDKIFGMPLVVMSDDEMRQATKDADMQMVHTSEESGEHWMEFYQVGDKVYITDEMTSPRKS